MVAITINSNNRTTEVEEDKGKLETFLKWLSCGGSSDSKLCEEEGRQEIRIKSTPLYTGKSNDMAQKCCETESSMDWSYVRGGFNTRASSGRTCNTSLRACLHLPFCVFIFY